MNKEKIKNVVITALEALALMILFGVDWVRVLGF